MALLRLWHEINTVKTQTAFPVLRRLVKYTLAETALPLTFFAFSIRAASTRS
jgi:hypothetical protein